jgi:hypothetical protein
MTIPTVYLDSQDFSRFTDIHPDYAETLPILTELRALKAAGQVRSVYSDIHLFEGLPYDRDAFKPGLARAKVIAELCDKNNAPCW